MTRLLLKNATLLDPESTEPRDEGLLLRDGRIEARLPAAVACPDDAEGIDCSGLLIAPGFLDLHFHGQIVFARGDGFRAALENASSEMVRHGTTGFLATTIAWSEAELAESVTQLASFLTQGDSDAGARPLGLHLEGPWINPGAAGAQPSSAIRPFVAREGEEILARAENTVQMVTLAPEIQGAEELLELLARRGVVAALGHSLVDEPQLEIATTCGLTHVTHLFNAMGRTHHREPGVPGLVLASDGLSCDLICDGAHVHPAMVKVAARSLRERLVLITDQIDPRRPSPQDAAAESTGGDLGAGRLRDDGMAWRLPDGRLAGSRLSLDRALANLQEFAALSLLEAVAACSLRPARVLGMEDEIGTLRPGARADLALLDSEGCVRETWIGGRRVYESDRIGSA